MRKLKFALVILSVFFLTGCDDDKADSVTIYYPSHETVNYIVTYKDGTSASIDSIKVYLENSEITPVKDYKSNSFRKMQITGSYLIVDNTQHKLFNNTTKTVKIVGYKLGNIIFTSKLSITGQEYNDNGNINKYYTFNPLHSYYKIKGNSSEGCTEQFESITLKTLNKENKPVALDSYQVIWDDKNITPITDFNSEDYKLSQKLGIYAIINDAVQDSFEGIIDTVTFKGYKDNKIIVEKDFIVGADKCHVTYLGDDPLTIIIEE